MSPIYGGNLYMFKRTLKKCHEYGHYCGVAAATTAIVVSHKAKSPWP
jgi:hypothetical protein